MSRSTRLLLILVFGICVSGCGRAAQGVRDTNDLKAVGIAYHSYLDAHKKAPSNADDLSAHLKEFPAVIEGLRNGNLIFIYGVSLQELSAKGGSFEFVIGYQRDVPMAGGPVLFGDGSVRQMTADEFRTAKKAR